MSPTNPDHARALALFRRGVAAYFDDLAGVPDARLPARLDLLCALEWVTQDSWPQLHHEATWLLETRLTAPAPETLPP
jgi:hypothetical protein